MTIKSIKKHFWKFVVFCFVGGTSFLIDWGIFNLTYKFTSFFVFSMFVGTLIAMIFNFSINRNFTFNAKENIIRKQIAKWLIVYLFAFFIRVITGKTVLYLLGGDGVFNANIAFLSGVALAIPISFVGSLLWVFKKVKN